MQPPKYDDSGLNRRTGFAYGKIYALLDSMAAGLGLVLTFVFAGCLLVSGFTFSWTAILFAVLFWLVLTYLALPRLHQIMTNLYLPDYFMARTKTGDGLLGDPVNLAFIGEESDLHTVMRNANWVAADPITLGSSLGIVRSTLTRKSYPEAPVSNLYLFGRQQDFAYQQEVSGNAAQRHHVRFWRVPTGWTLPGGVAVDWLAAGTYDKSVGISALTLQVTHKIDANIDAERNYVLDTIRYFDSECELTGVKNFSSAFHDRNGGGDQVYTDGNMPILNVSGAYSRAQQKNQPHYETAGNGIGRGRLLWDEEIPPTALHLVGFFLFLQVLSALSAWFGVGSVDSSALDHTLSWGEALNRAHLISADTIIQSPALWILTIMTILELGFWGLTMRRRPWARLILLILISVDALATILGICFLPAPVPFLQYINGGISLLLLLSMSSPAVRHWVGSLRLRSGGNGYGL